MTQLTFIRIVACSSQWMFFADTGPCEWHNRTAAFCFLSLLSPSPFYPSSSLRVYRPTRDVVSKITSRSAAFAWVIWCCAVFCGVVGVVWCCVVLCGVVWCFAVLWVLCGAVWCFAVLRSVCDILRCCMVFCCVVWCFAIFWGVVWCFAMLCVVICCFTCLLFAELPATPRKYL